MVVGHAQLGRQPKDVVGIDADAHRNEKYKHLKFD
jgi:hypothetical protein